jgi:hypothetical protein
MLNGVIVEVFDTGRCHQMVRHSPPEANDAIAEALTEIVWRTWYLESASR